MTVGGKTTQTGDSQHQRCCTAHAHPLTLSAEYHTRSDFRLSLSQHGKDNVNDVTRWIRMKPNDTVRNRVGAALAAPQLIKTHW
jgi:hypothetical protein